MSFAALNKPLRSGQSGSTLLLAIIITALTVGAAFATYELTLNHEKLASKLERNLAVDEIRDRIAKEVSCTKSMNAICDQGKPALVMRGQNLPLKDVDFFAPSDYDKKAHDSRPRVVPNHPNLSIYIRSRCAAKILYVDYVPIRAGRVTLDPLSRQPAAWRPLFDYPLCTR